MTPYTSCLRFGAALAIALVLVVGVLPGCIDMGNEPLLLPQGDAGVDTCEVNGGRCAGRPLVDLYGGPCAPTENEAPVQVCPKRFIELTALVCCTPKPACESSGRGTCEYEGSCDGDVIGTRFCANGKSCCVRSTLFDAGVVKPERDAAVDARDDASLDASSRDSSD